MAVVLEIRARLDVLHRALARAGLVQVPRGRSPDPELFTAEPRPCVAVGGREIPLTPYQAELYRLLRSHGGPHRMDALADALYEESYGRPWQQDNAPDDARRAIKAQVHHLRRRLAHSGVRIVTHRGRGYELVEPDGAQLLL